MTKTGISRDLDHSAILINSPRNIDKKASVNKIIDATIINKTLLIESLLLIINQMIAQGIKTYSQEAFKGN
jgi:hypothetical protein